MSVDDDDDDDDDDGRYACRGLFERHKLLFSFHMCAKILEAAGKLNVDEYNFFLRGGIVSLNCLLDAHSSLTNALSYSYFAYYQSINIFCIRKSLQIKKQVSRVTSLVL